MENKNDFMNAIRLRNLKTENYKKELKKKNRARAEAHKRAIEMFHLSLYNDTSNNHSCGKCLYPECNSGVFKESLCWEHFRQEITELQ